MYYSQSKQKIAIFGVLCLLTSKIKFFLSPKRNRQFVFEPKIEYKMTAERERSEREALTFPKWCCNYTLRANLF